MKGAIMIVSLMLIGGCGWKGLLHQEPEPSYLDNYSTALSQHNCFYVYEDDETIVLCRDCADLPRFKDVPKHRIPPK